MNTVPFFNTHNTRACLSAIIFSVMLIACSEVDSPLNKPPKPQKPELDFSLTEGKALNEFYRDGLVSAHAILTGGHIPRLIVGFPAGNSGVGVWFEPTDNEVKWSGANNKQSLLEKDSLGNTLYGMDWHTTVSTDHLVVENAVLSNIRILRDYMHLRTVPAGISNQTDIAKNKITWSRSRLDGKSSYKLAIEIENGSIVQQDNKIVLQANPAQTLKLHITALSGDKPLTPITVDELFNQQVAHDELSQKLLAFLSYQEKLLAGSWRFLTYFGRDTLLSTSLLMPVIKRPVVEAALGSVLARLAPNGEVAHEEDIGEYAVLHAMATAGQPSAVPHYDYKMVDDNFILACVLAQYLNTYQDEQAQIEAFLSRKTADGRTYAEQIVLNMHYVYEQALPFYNTPIYQNLVALKPDMLVGEWRDSNEGLGYGRYAYNVNAVFVPTALRAIATILTNASIAALTPTSSFAHLADITATWENNVPRFFEFKMANTASEKQLNHYAQKLGVPLSEKQISTATDFYAISLDQQGKMIPVLNSDIGFALMYQQPDEATLTRMLNSVFQDFPRGLITPIGMLVANPAFANEALQSIFSKEHYHGTVVWSWQQALLLSGLKKQLQRQDLDSATMTLLSASKQRLVKVIQQASSMKNSELWTWGYRDKFILEPFGQSAGHKSESNAAQLWSTVYLALPEIYQP